MTLIKSKLPGWTNLTDFFDDDWFKNHLVNGGWIPAVNVVDNDNNYEIEVAVPGFKKEDFNVSIENGVLNISGKTEKEEEEKKKNYTRKEFSSSSFSKHFTLPDNIEEKVVAKYNDGVLKLTLNKLKGDASQKKAVVVE